jgi:hypothetical protein
VNMGMRLCYDQNNFATNLVELHTLDASKNT